ncbi:MAG TPA: tRNA modification GTPase [Candidatus Tripitaka californicus]|uniref:tRNA modification GTPase n=1 Tax=Candidatus Tripitaka californicus TaxID=3367616 RepID=UPI004026473E|nr:tRNA modification GTPase [Planctomycetota bacterium]
MDTIVALASPGGNSPRAILKLSGGQALQIVLELFAPERPAEGQKLKIRHLLGGPMADSQFKYSCLKGNILVEEDTCAPCLLYVMRAPHSYTREDVVEVHTVGSPPLLEMLLEGLLSRARKSGRALRLAEPGEFTRRAFLNGRIDLSQAEAVLRIIRSRTDAELRLAARYASGGGDEISRTLKETQGRLAELLCLLELSLDFSDQDIEPLPQETLRSRLETFHKELSCYKKADETIKQGGIRTVFYGPPNAGKSSLFNALLGRPRAITSPHPGTTRDTIEAALALGGLSFCLVDTAGLQQTGDVEALAVVKSQEAVETSDLTLLVLDASLPETETLGLLKYLRPERIHPTILVINKSDLLRDAPSLEPLNLKLLNPGVCLPVVYTSALTGEGLERLGQEMIRQVLDGKVDSTPSPFNSRQRLILEEALEALGRALGCVRQSAPQELAALELREALDKLGEVCGTITSNDILGRIFSQFCIGK